MHREVDWMVPADEYILEFLASLHYRNKRVIQKPSSIGPNIGYGNRHTANRCSALSKYGLLERHDDAAKYTITDLGQRVVDNEISPEELNAIEPAES
ncbi:hypothetical protein [Halalkalicoccus sp. NIPERK01]|uniref:hypothetical protein n=1 Tax=Halalkalicoccus sp. NIPERK01 TaxID=3053469 RepID=UPI00256F19B3|nr:hypothetical protein [Halalkalicoccus sp. NIPERK01]